MFSENDYVVDIGYMQDKLNNDRIKRVRHVKLPSVAMQGFEHNTDLLNVVNMSKCI